MRLFRRKINHTIELVQSLYFCIEFRQIFRRESAAKMNRRSQIKQMFSALGKKSVAV